MKLSHKCAIKYHISAQKKPRLCAKEGTTTNVRQVLHFVLASLGDFTTTLRPPRASPAAATSHLSVHLIPLQRQLQAVLGQQLGDGVYVLVHGPPQLGVAVGVLRHHGGVERAPGQAVRVGPQTAQPRSVRRGELEEGQQRDQSRLKVLLVEWTRTV